jgi:hypothetical protein
MITKHQFESVRKLFSNGVNNYVQIRQQVGLTSNELDDIIANFDYYQTYFEEQEKLLKLREAENTKKKHWWQK